MPRGPKKNASQHSNRHENGIVAPGRRIVKQQKSNGQLRDRERERERDGDNNSSNTPSDGSSRADTPPSVASSFASPPVVEQSSSSTPPAAACTGASPASGPGVLSNGRLGPTAKGRTPSSSSQHQPGAQPSLSPSSSYGDGKSEEMASTQSRLAEQPAMKRSDSYVGRTSAAQDAAASSFHVAGTVLRSWPVIDTLAVLVFLLSLPPTLHNVINAVFTITTFVPPAGTFANFPTWSDLISSFSPTTPSLMVTALIDLAAMGLWVWLPWLFQALAIDSAQAIVATTLGGGYSNKPGSPDNTLLCLAFTMITHLASRYASRYKHTVMSILHRSEIERWPPHNATAEERSLSHDYPVGYERSWFDTIKVFLAIHIVCQGLTKMVRRSLSTNSRSNAFATTLSARGADGEAAGPTTAAPEPSETSNHHSGHQPQLRSKESLANLRETNRDKISSGKRRRKQGNYTRSQQPLWAAFAASKATIFQSIAENKASDDRKGTNAVDKNNLGDAQFDSCKNNIWITGIEPNSCFFETSQMDANIKNDATDASNDKTAAPFYVTVNGARWTSLKMEQVPTMEKPSGCWVGEIYGLSPACSYQIIFKNQSDGAVIYEEAIATTPAMPAADGSAAAPVVPAPILLPSSPASPIATLETSIASFETKIARGEEERRRLKKDARQAQQTLRREIDGLSDKISKQATNVQSLQARQTRENQHIRQAEDAINTMAEELDTWKEIPDEELDEYNEKKAEFESARNAHRDAKNDLVRSKEQNNRMVHGLQGDANVVKQKNERLQSRVARLVGQHDKLANPDASKAPIPSGPAGTETMRSNSSSSGSKSHQRAEKRQKWDDQIEGRQRMLTNLAMHYNHDLSQYRNLQLQMEAAQQAQQQAQVAAAAAAAAALPRRSVTPEGDLPGTVPHPPSSASQARPMFDISRDAFGTPDRFVDSTSFGNSHFDPLTPSSVSLHKTNSTGGHGKTKPHSSSFGARPRSTSIMSGNTIYQDVDEGSGGTDATSFDMWASPLAVGQFKRRSGGSGLARDGSNGGSSGSGSPLVAPGVIGSGNFTRHATMPQESTSWNNI